MRIKETASLRTGAVDMERARIRRVRIIEADKRTRNGTYYPRATLGAARGLFAGALVFPMHLDLASRSTRDIVGRLSERVEQTAEGHLVGDLVISESEPELLTKISEGLITDLSIDAHGRTRISRVDGKATRIVEKIHKVNSVDLVPEGAAGGQILDDSNEVMELAILDRMKLEELKESRPDLVERLEQELKERLLEEGEGPESPREETPEEKTARARAELIGLIEELKEVLRQALEGLRDTVVEGVRRVELLPAAREALSQSKLPREACERIEDQVLEALLNGEAPTAVIERERSYLAAASGSKRIRGAAAEPGADDGVKRLAEKITRYGGLG